MRLLWIGAAVLVLALIPQINYIIYEVGPNPTFNINNVYIQIGSNKYYLINIPIYVKLPIMVAALAIIGIYELRKGLKPRGGAIALALLALILALPIPLVFSESGGLTVVALSNAFTSAAVVVYTLGAALELVEYYVLPSRLTEIIALPESAAEKTEKA